MPKALILRSMRELSLCLSNMELFPPMPPLLERVSEPEPSFLPSVSSTVELVAFEDGKPAVPFVVFIPCGVPTFPPAELLLVLALPESVRVAS